MVQAWNWRGASCRYFGFDHYLAEAHFVSNKVELQERMASFHGMLCKGQRFFKKKVGPCWESNPGHLHLRAQSKYRTSRLQGLVQGRWMQLIS